MTPLANEVACRLAATPAPWTDGSVADVLRGWAARTPDEPAVHVVAPGGTVRSLTFAERHAEATRVARGLRTRLGPGTAVAVCAPNSIEWVLAEFGCAVAGTVLVPMNPGMTDPELTHILELTSPRLVLTVAEFRGQRLAERLARLAATVPDVVVDDLIAWVGSAAGPELDGDVVAADDDLVVQYTSGTTGRPKGAVHTHASAMNSGARWVEDWGAGPGDVVAAPVPLHHVGGSVSVLLGCVAVGATSALLTEYGPETFAELLTAVPATAVAAVPTMLFDLLRVPTFDLAAVERLRTVVGGGAAVPPATVRTVEETFGVRFVVVYGQSESPAILQTRRDDPVELKARTLGRPLPTRDVGVARPDGTFAGIGEVGEICTRSAIRMRHYLGAPEQTAEVVDDDGWLHTGDLGAMDAEGYVTFHGRARDVVIRGGENIYPIELETVIGEHPSVAAVAVVGAADQRWGEVPVAFVVAAGPEPVDPAALEAFARERLSSFKVPRRWLPVDGLPITASGKIRKVDLAASLTPDAGCDPR